jgi:hypothetical protein
MDFSKWSGILKLFLLRLVDELEKYLNKKNGQEGSPTMASALFQSMKFIILEQVDGLVNQAVDYTKKQIEELSSMLAKKLSVLLASMVYLMMIMGISLLGYIFLMISLSIYIGEIAGSLTLGFLYVGLANFGVAALVYRLGREPLQNKIREHLEKLL